MFSIGTIGGLILIFGAYLNYKGKAFYSIITYFIADFVWVFLSFSAKDYIGSILILIGMIFGILVFFKMKRGEFVKDLKVQ